MKLRKPILVTIILALVAAMTLFAVACGGEDDAAKTYTMRFETYGGTEIDPITAVGGSMIFAPSDPEKSGSTFAGWYTKSDFSGEAVEIPNVMPNKNVTYYAKFDTPKTEYTLIYEYNKGQVPHAANIANVTVEAGETVTVADGNDYGAVGYMFMGWSIYPAGLVADVKQDGQYNAGDKITLTDSNVKLYAQWAVEYTDARKENDDRIYVYEPLIGKGLGAAKLIRADEQKQDLEGFVKSGSETTSGSAEFTFYADEFENGEFSGRLYADRTYATADGKQGQYVQYDHVFGDIWAQYILALDGFGFATYSQITGSGISVNASGDYEYNEEYDDYTFVFNQDKDEDGAKPQTTYFILDTEPVEIPVGDSEETIKFDGLFAMIGGENGTYGNHWYTYNYNYYAYYYIELDGFGGATFIDESGDEEIDIPGIYYGTDNYTSIVGEWEFVPDDDNDAGYRCKFTLNVVQTPDGRYLPVFYICDEEVAGMYSSEDPSDKSTLYLDGYGMAEYTSNGVLYVGTVEVNNGVVEFTEYIQSSNGQMVETDNVMIFVLTGKKFALSPSGLIISEGVLTGYSGKAKIVEIPDTVTEIAENALNNTKTGVSLTAVTVPASVTKIGACAFENANTLRRVIFLSDTPVELDLSAETDPFRWAAGDFIIVVPQDDEVIEEYKKAWPKYADKIKGRVDAAKLPEFEVNGDGVLIRYNKPEDLEEGTLLDIVIPDEVTEIADYVFSGVTGIRSVNLNNVTKVGDNAFYACADLEKVIFAKYDEEGALISGVEELGVMAFAACDKLNNSGTADVLELPAIKVIGESAFSGCESLRLVRFGEGLTQIDSFAFYRCNVYEDNPPLFVELLGEKAPTMGEKITLGNIAFRFKVKDIKVAIDCYNDSTWSSYATNLYIESGEEKGLYMSGDVTLELDGRAIYQGSYVWLYVIDGEKITFYEYNSSSTANKKYATIDGTYKNGVIKVAIGNTLYYFEPIPERKIYKSKDGNYTLECNPKDLLPENYEDYKGYADVKFNGKDVKLFINGYRTKIINNYEDADGKLYDIYIDFNGDVLDVTKKLSDVRYSDIKAPDGSKITILFRNGLIYIEKAEFEIVADEATGYKLRWDTSVVFAKQNGKVFTFSFTFRSTVYNFTVTVSDDNTTFTYRHTTN